MRQRTKGLGVYKSLASFLFHLTARVLSSVVCLDNVLNFFFFSKLGLDSPYFK